MMEYICFAIFVVFKIATKIYFEEILSKKKRTDRLQ
jgi:hypothetical protein